MGCFIRIVLISIFIIGCSNHDEDMRLFMQSLPSEQVDLSDFNFILAGQSNAVSRSQISSDGTIPLDLPRDGYIANAKYYDDNDVLQNYDLVMNTHTTGSDGYGVEYRIAKYITEKSRNVNLLKIALGGQPVTGGCWAVNGSCTTQLIDRINSSGQTFGYLVWIQGESDSLTETVANQYYANATATFNKIRTETGQNIKFVLCSLSHNVIATPSLPYMYIINQALSDIADDIGNAVYVDVPEQGVDAILYEQHYNGLGQEAIALKIIETLDL